MKTFPQKERSERESRLKEEILAVNRRRKTS
jgi:hypothetical protein